MINIINFLITFLISCFISPIHGHLQTLPAYNMALTLFPHRIDTPRKIAALNIPYKLVENLTSIHICNKFPNWSPTTPGWDHKLNPVNLTLCAKDFGGGGNCLFYVVSGILRENGYNIGKFDFNRNDLSPGLKVSLQGRNFDKSSYFNMADIRLLSAMAYVGIDPENEQAQKYFDPKLLLDKVQFTVYSLDLDIAKDIQWDPKGCLTRLEKDPNSSLLVARNIFQKLCSVNPVNNWGSGEDLFALSEMLNVDFLLFHKDGEKIQHIMSSNKKPLCTINIYYYDMAHFQGAGVVANFISSNTRKISSLYRHFELDERLYDMLPKTKGSN